MEFSLPLFLIAKLISFMLEEILMVLDHFLLDMEMTKESSLEAK